METKIRMLTDSELETIKDCCHYWIETAGSFVVKEYASVGDMIDYLKKRSEKGYVVVYYDDDNFVGILHFNVGSMWWSDRTFIFEDGVLCVDQTYKGFLRQCAIPTLEALAKVYDVDAIFSGCLSQSNPTMVMNSYHKAGFRDAMPTCLKEVTKHE